jgi:hypothetical protein
LAEGWKKMGYADYLVKGGWNMTEVEAELGQDWLTQSTTAVAEPRGMLFSQGICIRV